MTVRNPFFIKGYHGPAYFCDREAETQKLLAAVRNGRDVTLMAPRRYGKTGLICHTLAQLGEGFAPIYLDIFQMRTLAEFTQALSGAVVSALATPLERTGHGLRDFFKSCRPTLSAQEDGSVSFSFEVVPTKAEATLKEVFAFLESRSVEPVIAIDEFHQVREFPEKGAEAFLRSHVQFCNNAHFIFAGSRKHLMEEMFALPRSPFYQSTQLMTLEVIAPEPYCAFARNFFARAGKSFSDAAFARIYRRLDGVTLYLQIVLNRVWERSEGLTDAVADEEMECLVAEGADTYADLLHSRSEAEQEVLRALAGGTPVREEDSPAVRAALEGLLDRDLVYRAGGAWRVYDRLFGLWLARERKR